MAFITPSNEQKAQMQNDATFRNEVKWAIFTLANYWSNQDGASLNAAAALNWRKHQLYSLQILQSPDQIDGNISQWATQFTIEAGNFQIVDDQAPEFTVAQVIDRMLDQNYFESIANLVFADKVSTQL
jgi:hypothetical protein